MAFCRLAMDPQAQVSNCTQSVAYYGVLTTTTMGQFFSLLFVSRYEEEWEYDRRELKEGYPYAYVWNREEEFGEIGSIQIKMEQGGLVRVA